LIAVSALSRQVLDEFCGICAWAHEAWETHRASFDDNPDAEAIRNVGANDAYLGRLSIITQEYSLQQIAKLHDPAIQQNGVNQTLERGRLG